MRPEACVTRNHIEVWHHGLLPPGARIGLWTVLRCSLLPILVWTGIPCFTCLVYSPVVTVVLGGLFVLSYAVSFGRRRRARHTLRCSAYGPLGGVLSASMAGFRGASPPGRWRARTVRDQREGRSRGPSPGSPRAGFRDGER